MLVDTTEFNMKADALRTKCVERLGSGGYYHQVKECNAAERDSLIQDIAKWRHQGATMILKCFPMSCFVAWVPWQQIPMYDFQINTILLSLCTSDHQKNDIVKPRHDDV